MNWARYQVDPTNPTSLVGRVLNTKTPILVPEAAEAQAQAITQDPQLLEIERALHLTSYLVVPLLARNEVRGTLFMAMAESQRSYQAADLALAQELAHRAAISLDNAELYQQAQEAVRVRDLFLSVASHELKTPLTTLLGNAQLLYRRAEREGHFPERDQRTIRVISEQAQRLNGLVTTLLDLSRIEQGQLTLEQVPVDVDALIRRVVDEIRLAHDQHPIAYQVQETPCIVIGDTVRLEQVVQNLISNAIKYSPPGEPVTVAVMSQGEKVCVSVADRGIGIPAENLPNLFGRFYRARNAEAHQITGLGIGLFVVKEIVTLHGGTIEVTSTEGVGSTFTICLPRAPLTDAGEPPVER
jgi:signal transduction histidine kinase